MGDHYSVAMNSKVNDGSSCICLLGIVINESKIISMVQYHGSLMGNILHYLYPIVSLQGTYILMETLFLLDL